MKNKFNWSFPSMIFVVLMLNVWRKIPLDTPRGFLASLLSCMISFGIIGWWWRK